MEEEKCNDNEGRLEYTTTKAVIGLALTGIGAYLAGMEIPSDLAPHQYKAFQILKYFSLGTGLGLSVNAWYNYANMIENPN